MKNKFSTKKIIIVAVSFLLLLVILKKVGVLGGDDKMEVTAEQAELRTIVETVSASGKIQPEVEVKISSGVSGELIEMYVKEGQEVKKGDLLCKIDPDIYITALDRMNASVSTSKANLANSKARLLQVKAQFANAEASYNRNKKLIDQGAISPAEFDAAKASYESAKATVESSEQDVNAAEYNIKNSQASLQEANVNLSRTTIVSPVNGKVSKLNVEKGDRVLGTSQMAGTEIMRIANLNEMEVNVDVNENDIIRLSIGDTSDIEIDAYLDRKFKGVVTEVANSASVSGISSDQVTNFTVKVRIIFDSYKDLIPANDVHYSPFRPGMSATVEIRTNVARNVITVPIQAVATREDTSSYGVSEKGTGGISIQIGSGGNSNASAPKVDDKEKDKKLKPDEYVFVLENGKAKLSKVKTGIQDNNYIEILSGLEKGTEIISGPYSAVAKMLKNNTPVAKTDKDKLFDKVKED
jgi:HlyD family secretion protein